MERSLSRAREMRGASVTALPRAPREHGILFQGEMVREILADRKTQTRRLPTDLRELHRSDTRGYDWAWRDRRWLWNEMSNADLLASRRWCPVQVGDRLWARETFALLARPCFDEPGVITKGGGTVAYRASVEESLLVDRWRPSIFMPRWASRITLEVTAVRLERLQDISEDDARAEGVDAWMDALRQKPDYDPNARLSAYPVTAFSRLWDSINFKRAPWSSNPLVWVRTFRRLP